VQADEVSQDSIMKGDHKTVLNDLKNKSSSNSIPKTPQKGEFITLQMNSGNSVIADQES
jgi:hypothetical protein